MINKVAIVGTGNIAWHLSDILLKIGVEISCISSRNHQNAEKLATLRKSKAIDLKSLDSNIDLIIIAVSDDAIYEVSQQIPEGDYIVTHTSGSVSIDVFKNRFKHFGVLYPLQSFSKSKKIDFKKVPILIEGDSKQTSMLLESFAKKISERVELMNSEQRGNLHLSAVIVNNFVNFLVSKSYDFLENNNIDGSLLQPLMRETIERLRANHPREMQTGPAKRNDKNVIEKHLKQLESNPKLQSLYQLISQQIIEEYHGC
jgi:predicted short-subunit dehydrogenase-like oxidoreductase (DUF2520 family)